MLSHWRDRAVTKEGYAVRGMEIRPEEAAASEEHDGVTLYFCSESCHQAFLADPHRYGHPAQEA